MINQIQKKMKKSFTFFLFLVAVLMTSRAYSQELVITEIMYNDPSTGGAGDSLEFVEIYNNTADPYDMTGYQLTTAITFTFPSFTLQPYSYVVVAKNSTLAQTYYGVIGAYQWTAGQSLANNGASIVLKSNLGVTLDSLLYSFAAPWPISASGNGSSIMLCDPNADNTIGGNWTAGTMMNANAFAPANGAPVYATPTSGCNTPNLYVPTFAAIPYTQNFDGTWVNGEGLRDVPDFSCRNYPAIGNNAVRRDDDGHTGAGWGTVTGAYTPAGANSTTHSARFHSAGTTISNEFDLYLDFNTNGIKKLKFWYVNTNGTDSLALYLSEDGGGSFNFLSKYVTTTGWQLISTDLGTSESSTVVLRFKSTGTAAAGGSDIGFDGIEVYLAPGDDAGIAAITNPPAAMSSSVQDVTVDLKNYGSNDLTSVNIEWSVNGTVQPSLLWSGFISPGSTESGIIIGNYTFSATGASVVKAWTSMPNGNTDGDNSNDTINKNVFYQPYAPIPFYEGFDSLWVNKANTNDVPSAYWSNNPSTGNASWRRADDGASANWTNINTGIYNPTGANTTTLSARFHSNSATNGATGVMDCYVDFTTPGAKLLKFYYINTSGADSLAVWKSEDGGSTFTFLQKFTTVANWTLQTIGLGVSESPNVIVRFRATKNTGGVGAQTDIGLDGVVIELALPDVMISSIVSPVSGCGLSSNEVAEIILKNNGFTVVNDIPVYFDDNNGNVVSETAFGTLNPGESMNYAFSNAIDLSVLGAHSLKFFTAYPDDNNLVNDTLKKAISNLNVINTFPFLEDFEAGLTNYLILEGATNAAVYVDTAVGVNNSKGLRMTGGAVAGTWPNGSGNNTTAAQAFGYTDHLGMAATCMVDATNLIHPELRIDLRQTFITNGGGPRYSFFRVLINDTILVSSETSISNFNPITGTADAYANQIFDLSAFGNTQFIVTLQSSCKYAPGGTYGLGDNAFVDNFIIAEKPAQEVGVLAITSPVSSCGLGSTEHISVSIRNNGTDPASNFEVKAKADNGTWITETFTGTIDPDSAANYTFTNTVNLSSIGVHNLVVALNLTGDPIVNNDTIKSTVSTTLYVSSYPHLQDFEGSYSGWNAGIIAGTTAWELGTPAKTTIVTAHSGTEAWVTNLTANYTGNSNTWVATPCFNFTNLVHPYLSVWLNFVTQANFDAMIMEVSVNDSAWYKLPVDTLFYNSYNAAMPVAPPKWSGNSNGWNQYGTSVQSLAGKTKVVFRFRFQTNNTNNNEGFAIDDFEIKEATADVECLEWVSPKTSCGFTATEPIIIRVRNTGQMPLTDLPVAYSTNGGGTQVLDTIHATIAPATQYDFTFTQTANLSSGGPFSCVAYTNLAGDPTPTNNSVTQTLTELPSISSVPFTETFETTNDYFALVENTNSAVAVVPGIGLNASTGIQFTGNAQGTWPGGTSQNTTAAQAWSYTDHIATASTCDISVTAPAGLWLKLALRQAHSTGPMYSWFRVMLNNTTQLVDTAGVTDYNPATGTADPFAYKVFVLTQYLGSPFTISLQASCKYSDATGTGGNGDKAEVDSVQLIAPIPVGIENIQNNAYLMSYPNPTNGSLRVEFGTTIKTGQLVVLDAIGKEVLNRGIDKSQGMNLDLSNMQPGVYCLMLKYENSVITQKIVKQ
jgi:hypothetical protein